MNIIKTIIVDINNIDKTEKTIDANPSYKLNKTVSEPVKNPLISSNHHLTK